MVKLNFDVSRPTPVVRGTRRTCAVGERLPRPWKRKIEEAKSCANEAANRAWRSKAICGCDMDLSQ